MRIFDTFPMHDELDILECRLVELEDVPNLLHVIVESDVTHQDNPKPSYLRDNWSRFEKWADRIVHVWATGLPTITDDADPWAREHAQREHVWTGLRESDAQPDDVVLHGDIDEIPTSLVCRNIRPGGRYVSFEQRGHFWAVDWLYPQPWMGTVAAEVSRVGSFGAMRDTRNTAPIKIPNAGWHLSWLGGRERALKKVGAFCHPEVQDRILEGLDDHRFYRDGVHVDGLQMRPVEVDRKWPKWIVAGYAPESWYRPR